MCGIAGFLQRDAGPDQAAALARAMGDQLRHRGPDDGGEWTDDAAGIALAHRRLSIVDLSPAGHQPMISANGRFVISYNGEIFNADAIGRQLNQPRRGHSDTEIILEACASLGVLATIRQLIGMFALALWDRQDHRLWLVRDRMGIKPLYWGRFGSLLLFGSELKALRAHPGWTAEIDPNALAGFLRNGYVAAPGSIYRGVRKLEPGCILEIDAEGSERLHRYWSLRQVIEAGRDQRQTRLDPVVAVDQLEALLKDAVGRRMVADVPLGAFLSGGIDSSVVVALMQAQSSRPVRTFSIGFSAEGYDEAPYARQVAQHLGTDHQQIYVTGQDALALVPRLATIYDEPFADSSQIPTLLICQAARQQVTVALSGDGGDELFAGYNRYRLHGGLWRLLTGMPGPVRQVMARALTLLPVARWDRLLRMLSRRGFGQPGDKLHKLAAVIAAGDAELFYRRLISHWPDPASLVQGGAQAPPFGFEDLPADLSPRERMQAADQLTYLPDDILAKVDRASMAVALEVRVPLLDHRVVEQAWTLPADLQMRGDTGKWLLRQLLYRHVPQAMVERPKMGFGVPLDGWLRGPLRDWAEALLDRQTLGQRLDAEAIGLKWRQHLAGSHNWQHLLWDVLMFESWRQANL
ncbi:MAG TPA: asparagine synthase (glutamine-hydrolyzing) [Rhodospirillaceae bacterium]|nr:asparagine synthase (glutamine-hydrolyzing) [Rhodospirillaceae bacterium]